MNSPVKRCAKPSFRATLLVLLAGVALLFAGVFQSADLWKDRKQKDRDARSNALAMTRHACGKLDATFRALMEAAEAQAALLSKERLSRKDIEHRMRAAMNADPRMFGIVVGMKPFATGPGTRLYAPYFFRKDGHLAFSRLEESYDYTTEKPGENWYRMPMQNGKGWSEPYFGTVTGGLLAVYAVPFHAPGETDGPTGVVAAVCSLESIRDIMDSLNLDSKGFGYLVSRTGVFLSHPDRKLVSGQKNIREVLALKIHDTRTIDRIMGGRGEVVEYVNELIGRRAIAVTVKVPATGYTLGTAFDHDLLTNDQHMFRRRIIEISLCLSAGVLLLLVYSATRRKRSLLFLWTACLVFAVVLVLEIVIIWHVALRYTPYSRPGTEIIYDQASLKGFINAWRLSVPEDHPGNCVTVPTGVFVQSLEFTNANNVHVSGNIWQRYDSRVPGDVTRGFILPEAVESTITEVFRRKDEAGETIGWSFQATLRQEFDYSRYPLDSKDMWLRLRPADFDRNILLTPDLGSYTVMDPKTLPGVEKQIVLAEWNARESFFSYVKNSYNTYFGRPFGCAVGSSPELYFTIIIARRFINPFVNSLLPFLVISAILFCTQLLVYSSEENVRRFNISVGEFLAACSGLLFSVLIAHNGLRASIAASGFLYLENFYFVMYGAIIVVMVNTFCVAYGNTSFLITHRDNLIIKLLFWPVILGVLLLITVGTFY